MVLRDELVAALDRLLDPGRMEDHGPNGLQVEGRQEIRSVVSAVTASRNVIEAAVAKGADAVLVHHGLFWEKADRRLAGWLGARVRLLMKNDISLIAYHLPLDVHPTLGNNAMLVRGLGLKAKGDFGERGIGAIGEAAKGVAIDRFVSKVESHVGGRPTHLEGSRRTIKRVGVVTGAGQRYFEAAIAAGCDAFVTGEASEAVTHIARETGVHYVWAGHHATEKGGVQALGTHLSKKFGVAVIFVDDMNPV